jgi:hypothetical protein
VFLQIQVFWDVMLCRWVSGSRNLKKSTAFILKNSGASQPLKMTVQQSLKMSGTPHPTQRHVPDDLIPHIWTHSIPLNTWDMMQSTVNFLGKYHLQERKCAYIFDMNSSRICCYWTTLPNNIADYMLFSYMNFQNTVHYYCPSKLAPLRHIYTPEKASR